MSYRLSLSIGAWHRAIHARIISSHLRLLLSPPTSLLCLRALRPFLLWLGTLLLRCRGLVSLVHTYKHQPVRFVYECLSLERVGAYLHKAGELFRAAHENSPCSQASGTPAAAADSYALQLYVYVGLGKAGELHEALGLQLLGQGLLDVVMASGMY